MLVKVSMETIETTATVLFIVAAASIFGWLLTATRVTDMVTAWVLGFTHSPWVFLLLVNLLLLFVGCFLEPTAAILIAIPVLMPVVTQLGIDPVHFGLIVVLNLMIGLLHPPMGMVLYVLARVARMSLERTTMAILPWLVPLLGSLILITYVPIDLAVAAADVLPLEAQPWPRSNASRSCRSTCRRRSSRTDAIQSFVTQETPMVRITCDDGAIGTGYTYTIGTGGSSVVALLRDHLAPRLIGRDAAEVEAIWKDLFFATHATAVGAITSLALAAIDTALWDLKCRRAGRAAVEDGGRRAAAGARLHDRGRLAAPFARAQLVDEARGREGAGFPRRQDEGRQAVASPRTSRACPAVRAAVGDAFELMVDANQAFTVAEALPARARLRRPDARLVRGAAAGGGPGRPRRARAPGGDADRGRRVALPPLALPRVPRARAPARWSRSTARASAASRRGSRSRTSPRRSTCRSARTS